MWSWLSNPNTTRFKNTYVNHTGRNQSQIASFLRRCISGHRRGYWRPNFAHLIALTFGLGAYPANGLDIFKITEHSRQQNPTDSSFKVFFPTTLNGLTALEQTTRPVPTPDYPAPTPPDRQLRANCDASQYDDSDADGHVDSVWSWKFDSRGRSILSMVDFDADGQIDASQHSTYRTDGELLEQTYDANGDGSPDQVTQQIFGGPNNLWIETTKWHNDSGDSQTKKYFFDGVDLSYEYVVDADGKNIGSIRHDYINSERTISSIDNDGDGVENVHIKYAWSNGLISAVDTSAINNGALTHRSNQYSYDEQGRLTRAVYGNDPQHPQSADVYWYDAVGNLIRQESQNVADNAAPTVEWSQDLTYSQGRLNVIEEHTGLQLSRRAIYQYSCR